MTDLVPLGYRELPDLPLPQAELLRHLQDATHAVSTRRVYASHWRTFLAWAAKNHIDARLPLDPPLVLQYVLVRAPTTAPSTLRVLVSALRFAHLKAGFADPTKGHPAIADALKGHSRSWTKPKRAKAALRTEHLRRLLPDLASEDPRAIRDRALILVGFAGGFRRSELAAVRLGDLHFEVDGVRVYLPKSKTDQEGAGRYVGIPTGTDPGLCPVRALNRWINVRAGLLGDPKDEDSVAPLWASIDQYGKARPGLSGGAVARMLLDYAEGAGLDPKLLGGHSLRAGFVTEAAMAGAAEWQIAEQTGHRDGRTLRKYIRESTVLKRVPKVL